MGVSPGGWQMIWSSDLLNPLEASARLVLDLIGEVTLDRKTTVRISTNPADAGRPVYRFNPPRVYRG